MWQQNWCKFSVISALIALELYVIVHENNRCKGYLLHMTTTVADRSCWAESLGYRVPSVQTGLFFLHLSKSTRASWNTGKRSYDAARQIQTLLRDDFWRGSQVARGAKWESRGWNPASQLATASLCVSLETLCCLKAATGKRKKSVSFQKYFDRTASEMCEMLLGFLFTFQVFNNLRQKYAILALKNCSSPLIWVSGFFYNLSTLWFWKSL